MPSDSKSTKTVPVSAPVSAPAPVSVKSKKVNAKAEEPVAVSAPVAETPAPKQKGGKVSAPEPVAPVEVAAPKKAGKKVVAVVDAVPAVEAPTPKQKGGKKVAADGDKKPKVAKQPKAKKVVADADANAEADADDKGVRSFKVKLPGSEDFAGRFTGLTPYQAANKALSKYFRENKTVKNEINFTIVESTRGSKRSTYVYNGKREKLETPVKYSIKGTDGEAREIVKEYKNKLTKVKKAVAKGEAKTETA